MGLMVLWLQGVTQEGIPLLLYGEKTATSQVQCISDEVMKTVTALVEENMVRLKQSGQLSFLRTAEDTVRFDWPLRLAPGSADLPYYSIGSFFDHDKNSNQVLDYSCRKRTYDGHNGTDITIWPFFWKKMDEGAVDVIAASDGIVIGKHDGDFDRNCGFSNDVGNFVIILNADSSKCHYLHMKKGSVTTKEIGARVTTGEYLGKVGSSGNSSNPHLHFAVQTASGEFVDPFSGECNKGSSRWISQKPYNEPTLHLVATHPNKGEPIFPGCPLKEVPNIQTNFQPGDLVLFSSFFHDQIPGDLVRHRIYQPDNSLFREWTQILRDTLQLSLWITSWRLPDFAAIGVWRYEATYYGKTLSTSFTVKSVSGKLSWARSIGGTGLDAGKALAPDADGNVYLTGSFQISADFDRDTGRYKLTAAGNDDILISKLDGNGRLVWAKSIGGPENEHSTVIKVDSRGNIFIGGSFQGTADFDPDTAIYQLTASGGDDIFLAKLDTSGRFLWAKIMGGIMGDHLNAMAVDSGGNIYLTGSFQGNADFDPDAGNYQLTSSGSEDIFVSKLSADGNFVWARKMGGPAIDKGNGIALDISGNVIITGSFEGLANFNPGIGAFNLTSSGGYDIFVAKLDGKGNVIWAKRMGGMAYDVGNAIVTDLEGNILGTGFFQGSADFDPEKGNYFLNSYGLDDIFIFKLDAKGYFIWAKKIGGSDSDIGNSIALDASGNIFTTGFFGGWVSFYTGGLDYYLSTSGKSDMFISKMDHFGNLVWAKKFGGTGFDVGNEAIADVFGDVYIIGSFEEEANVYPILPAKLTSKGSSDVFVVKYSHCDNTSSTQTAVACGTYSWNEEIYKSSGIYHLVLPNEEGCDSVLLLNLTIKKAKIGVSQIGNVLVSEAIGAKYQWLDCNNNFAKVEGQNSQVFIPSINGDFAVEVADTNGCIDTSLCYKVVVVGIEDGSFGGGFAAYPNPTSGSLTIDFGEPLQMAEIIVTNVLGQEVRRERCKNSAKYNMVIPGENGIYLLIVRSENKIAALRILKQ